jgi:hypothetical protein
VCKGNVIKKTTKDKNGDSHDTYVCEPLCNYALKVIDPRPAGTSSVKYNLANGTKKVAIADADYNNWFENMFKTKTTDRCAINYCKLYNSGCKSVYSGNKLAVSKKGSKITFEAATNVPDGWTQTVCVGCSNGKDNVFKDNWIVN